MPDMEKVISEEKPQHFVPRLKRDTCKCRKAFSNHCAIYVFPVCTFLASLVLVSLAFKTAQPGVSLGFSFLLFILAIVYCVIANTVKVWMPDSEHERSDGHLDSDSDMNTNTTVVVVSSLEEIDYATRSVV
ncbi:hypothetical protein OS493_030082 [Desmophyllum pertusum]|uniref:Uncharacterized protein n=1 Tax=Desmophyllum pertusum TaxID=174260 RepID=A0A9W9Z976_9CNID|nr:hypothetical protein OS493_030082 [Desmophyllum pertusum]